MALFAPSARAEAEDVPPRPEDEGLMREAIALAQTSDFPFGAIIARDGEVLARGPNLGKRLADPTAHAEMVAIRRFIATRPPDELRGATLYTSAEPCPMCIGAIIWSGLSRVVFGASVDDLAPRIGPIALSAREVAQRTPFARVAFTGGVLRAEALALFERRATP
ncbi:nucleoside deaminase [Xanthobacter sp. V4C-4]|uniref:nucleoside deaminase n=1 Tax=Xanthobacter cornucopiae TaxID=3119924 RepID=UPI00372CB1B1